MRIKNGKVGENVLKRSVLPYIKTTREEVLIGAGIGEDCAFLAFPENELLVLSMDPITVTSADRGYLAVINGVNDLAAGGAEPVGIMVSILLPPKTTETKLKAMMAQIEEQCSALHIQLMGGHTEATPAVNMPILTVTAVGKVKKEESMTQRKVKAGHDIVMSKWMGLEGTGILANEREAELLQKFPPYFVKEAKGFLKYLPILPEAAIARKSGASMMHDVTEGGVFGALWEMAEKVGVGLEIDMKKLPVKQETIEICEHYGLNPYEFLSGGSLLIAIEDGYELVKNLAAEGIDATVIGKVTEGNDRVIINGEERRFLEPAKPDEIYRVEWKE